MVNEVLQTVMDYVKLPHTDYAILINGPWGCGKTYFWKNMVEPQLQTLLKPKQIERVMYVSLYGISNVRDIDRSMFAQSYPGINHKVVGRVSRFLGGAAEALGRIDLEKVDLRSLTRISDAVICFDDLERCDLSTREVLGYINTFVEHEGAKAIILCNEKGIDADDLDLYRKMKEKVVGSSFDFRVEPNIVLSALSDEYKSQTNFHDFLIKNADLILHLFKCSETNNLRALRRAITALNMTFSTILEGGIDPNKLAEQLIYAIGLTAFELYGRTAEPEKLRAIHAMEFMSIAGISRSVLKTDETTNKTYEEEFNGRYFKQFGFLDIGNAVGCPPICDYMITGYLNKDSLLAWAKELTCVPDEKYQRIQNLMSNAREMEDQEFEQTVNDVLADIESGALPQITTYLKVWPHLEWFVKEKLIAISSIQLLAKFEQGLRTAREAHRLEPNQHLKHTLHHYVTKPISNECQTLCDLILQTNKELLENNRIEHIQQLLLDLQDNPQALMTALTESGDSGLLLKPIFHKLDAAAIGNQICLLSNHSKMLFGLALNERYLAYQPQSEYLDELPGLTAVRDALKGHCPKSTEDNRPKLMSIFIIEWIVQAFEEAIALLEKLRREKEEANRKPNPHDQQAEETGGE